MDNFFEGLENYKFRYKKSSRFIEEQFHGHKKYRTNRLSCLLFKRDEFDEDILQTISITKGRKSHRLTYKKYY